MHQFLNLADGLNFGPFARFVVKLGEQPIKRISDNAESKIVMDRLLRFPKNESKMMAYLPVGNMTSDDRHQERDLSVSPPLSLYGGGGTLRCRYKQKIVAVAEKQVSCVLVWCPPAPC